MRRHRRDWTLGSFALAAFLAGCGLKASWPPSPIEVRPGEDACSHCRMIVGDARFAAQLHLRDGTVEIFDDLGCLLVRCAAGDFEPAGAFVRDASSDRWLRADSAFAVRSQAVASPMGSGYAAFATRERAEEEARRLGGGDVAELMRLMNAKTPESESNPRR